MRISLLLFGTIALTGLLAGRLAAEEPRTSYPSASAFLAYGKRLFTDTKALMPADVGASFSCESCHVEGGTRAHALSLRGIYTKFPQWNGRAGRYIEVQDRIAECFLYSMHGRPPAYSSKTMIALTAYIASLSKGVRLGSGVPDQELVPVIAPQTPNPASGGRLFAIRCAACHAANGHGTAAAPPLWGPGSYDTGAGMYRGDTLSSYIRYAMPFGSPPNTLSKQEAVNVAAYILSKPRPPFRGHAPIIFRPKPAYFF